MLLSHRKMECAQRIILLSYRQFQKHYVKKLRRISEGQVVRDTISHCLLVGEDGEKWAIFLIFASHNFTI